MKGGRLSLPPLGKGGPGGGPCSGYAIDREKAAIEQEDYHYGLNKLKNEYYSTISYNEESGLDARDYYNILVDCCNSEDKRPEDVKGLMDLKHNLCILGYNGDHWYDVHPVDKDLLEDLPK